MFRKPEPPNVKQKFKNEESVISKTTSSSNTLRKHTISSLNKIRSNIDKPYSHSHSSKSVSSSSTRVKAVTASSITVKTPILSSSSSTSSTVVISEKISATIVERVDKSYLYKNYKSNDLLFGLLSAREIHVDYFKSKGISYLVANFLNDGVMELVVTEESKKKLEKLSSRKLNYYQELMAYQSYFLKAAGKPIKSMEDKALGNAYRRGCKWLIVHASDKRRVHYELDQIDMNRVCKADPDDLGISNSELRAAYRAEKAAGKPNPHLFFYNKGVLCEAPWKDPASKKEWVAYEEKRQNKRK